MSEIHSSKGMAEVAIPSGFSFDNYERNQMIMKMNESIGTNGSAAHPGSTGTGFKVPNARKTGTTICGIVFKDGIILGADTRATAGEEIVEKDCDKIHKISENIFCCGAGTAADTQYTTELIASQLEILRMETHATTSPLDLRVVAALTRLKRLLFRYQGYIGAALILGGVDNVQGPQLYSIHPHGSTARFPYISMGSGSLAAMSILETSWVPDLSEEEGVTLVKRAIAAGIFNDLGSGSNISICVLRTDGTVDYNHHAETPNEIKAYRDAIVHSERLIIAPGTTPVVASSFTPHTSTSATLADVTVTTEGEGGGEKMEE